MNAATTTIGSDTRGAGVAFARSRAHAPPTSGKQPPPGFTKASQASANPILRDRFEGSRGGLEDMESDLRDLPGSRPAGTRVTADPPARGRATAALISVCLGFFVIQLDRWNI